MQPGDRLALTIERPAAGGRMIARHEGQVVLVSGAIPGEQVVALVERVERRLAFAAAVEVVQPSPDRRSPPGDPMCGGCLFAHIEVPRQRTLKAQIVADAFARIGRHPLAAAVDVAESPEHGYRMRARLHVRDGRTGFYREGSHELCDAGATGQMAAAALRAAERARAALATIGAAASSIEIADNLAGDQRALHIELSDPGRVSDRDLEAILDPEITALSVATGGRLRLSAGPRTIFDPLATLTAGRAEGELHRSAESFFQSNRFLVQELALAVMAGVLPHGEVLDLYAGVGLFAAALAGAGRPDVTAVEGDAASGADLRLNGSRSREPVTVIVGSVERYLSRLGQLPPTVIVDPPRTGLSSAALDMVASRGGARLVYVSCDPATLARDARALIDGGYRLGGLRAFDFFPNTPHVECIAVFDR